MQTPSYFESGLFRKTTLFSLSGSFLILAFAANSKAFTDPANTRGSIENKTVFSNPISSNDSIPLVSADFEDLPLLSDEGDLVFTVKPVLVIDYGLARSQVGKPVSIGQLVDNSLVPQIPTPKDIVFDQATPISAAANRQVAALDQSLQKADFGAPPPKRLNSVLLVKKPEQTSASQPALKPKIKPQSSLARDDFQDDATKPYLPPLTLSDPKEPIQPVSPIAINKVQKTVTKAESDTSTPKGKLVATVLFPKAAATLPEKAEPALKSLATKLKANPDLAIKLLSYASYQVSDLESSKGVARRLSLSRALSARKFFISQGISAERLDIRSLEQDKSGKNSDRLEIFVL